MIEEAFSEYLMRMERQDFVASEEDITELYEFIDHDDIRPWVTLGETVLEKTICDFWENNRDPSVLELAGICLYFCGKLYESMEG